MFQFTEQLIYFTNKHTYPGDHCNDNYNILRKNLDTWMLMAKTKQKMNF